MNTAEKLDLADNIFVIQHFLDQAECRKLIERTEQRGYHPAPLSTTDGPVFAKEIRNNTRVMIDDKRRAGQLWKRVRPFIPDQIQGWQATGLNERFRFYRYDIAERFAPHMDGCFSRPNGEQSKLTLMIFLNDVPEGGGTQFLDAFGTPKLYIKPERGKVLVFAHEELHEGTPPIRGRKYVLRTDVMYRKVQR